MKVSAPKAILDLDYRKLTVTEGQGEWRMVSLNNSIFTFDEDAIPQGQVRRYYDQDHKLRMVIRPRNITIMAGYAWNGNSPKCGVRFLWRDWWFGTPDFFPQTVKASQLHDALFQFSGLMPDFIPIPFTLPQANSFYHQIAKAHGHPLDDTYHLVLKICAARSWAKPNPLLTSTIEHENESPVTVSNSYSRAV